MGIRRLGDYLWHSRTPPFQSKLNRIQRKTFRCIGNSRRTSGRIPNTSYYSIHSKNDHSEASTDSSYNTPCNRGRSCITLLRPTVRRRQSSWSRLDWRNIAITLIDPARTPAKSRLLSGGGVFRQLKVKLPRLATHVKPQIPEVLVRFE